MSDSFEKNWRKRFEKYAQEHENDAAIAGWSETGLQARLRNFKRLWDTGKSANTWLDVGCGAGTYSHYLVGRDCNVTAMDYSFPTLKKGRERVTGVKRWIVGDVTKLPLQADSYDGVICFGVIQALSESERAIEELVRVVKPGGQVWLDALNAGCIPHQFDMHKAKKTGEMTRVRYESRDHLKRIMKENGLERIKSYWVPILPARYHKYQWLVELRVSRMIFALLPFFSTLVSHGILLRGIKK